MALSTGAKLTDLNQYDIKQLQQLLMRAGFDPGPVDGALGPKTKAAYARFLTANGYADQFGVNTDVVERIIPNLASVDSESYWLTIVRGNEVQMTDGNPATAVVTSTGGGTAGTPAAAAPATTPAQGTGTTTPVAPSDGSVEEYVRKNFPQLAYLLDNPEVKEVLLWAQSNLATEAELQGRLFTTSWWKTTSDSTRLWDQKMAQDPATANREWDQRSVEILNMAKTLGAAVDDNGAKWLAGKVLREGWSDNQLRRYLGGVIRGAGGADPGSVTARAATMKASARSYLSTMSDKDALEWAIRVSEGSADEKAVDSMLRDQAKGRFYWLKDQIEAGLTPQQLFASTRNQVAQLLEVEPDQIDLNSPKWSVLTAPITESGSTRSMNFSEASRWARQQSEWRYTQNANDESSKMVLGLMKSLGVMA